MPTKKRNYTVNTVDYAMKRLDEDSLAHYKGYNSTTKTFDAVTTMGDPITMTLDEARAFIWGARSAADAAKLAKDARDTVDYVLNRR